MGLPCDKNSVMTLWQIDRWKPEETGGFPIESHGFQGLPGEHLPNSASLPPQAVGM